MPCSVFRLGDGRLVLHPSDPAFCDTVRSVHNGTCICDGREPEFEVDLPSGYDLVDVGALKPANATLVYRNKHYEILTF